jgi:hypothetical protein
MINRGTCPKNPHLKHMDLAPSARYCSACGMSNPMYEDPFATPTSHGFDSHTSMSPIIIPDDSPYSSGPSSTMFRQQQSGNIVSSLTSHRPPPYPRFASSLQDARNARTASGNISLPRLPTARNKRTDEERMKWNWKISFHIVYYDKNKDFPDMRVYYDLQPSGQPPSSSSILVWKRC